MQVDERFRVTLPKKLRETFSVSAGDRLYIIVAGDTLLLKKIPKNPAGRLSKLIGHIKFDRSSRRRAEEWLLRNTPKRS